MVNVDTLPDTARWLMVSNSIRQFMYQHGKSLFYQELNNEVAQLLPASVQSAQFLRAGCSSSFVFNYRRKRSLAEQK